MNKIKDEEIMQVLYEQEEYLKSIYDEKQILGIFVYGKANYGFAESIEDIKTVACYIPTFEEICCESYNVKIFYIKDNKDRQIRMCDMRLINMLARNQEQIIMETVFSNYCLINSRYKKVFNKYIYMNKEAIFHCNQKLRIKNSANNGLEALKRYEETKNLDDAFEACRLRIACELYISGASVENCINLKKDYHINYLNQIKDGTITPNIEETQKAFENILLEAQDFKENKNCEFLIKNSIIELMKVALTDMNSEGNFLSLLTKTEIQAFEIILQHLNNGHEGNISISQLTEDSKISRPVFKNTLQKMKDNNVAEIINQGVKGMYVKIIDGDILAKQF